MSSTLYSYCNAKKSWNKRAFKFSCREGIRQSIRKVYYRDSRVTLLSCDKLMCSCKNEAHVANHCNYKRQKKILALQHMLTLTKQE